MRGLLRSRSVQMGLSVGLAALIIVALFLIAAALLLSTSQPSTPPIVRAGETILRFAFSAVLLLLLVTALLQFTTPEHVRVKWVTLGSSITIVIWLAASWIFGWYIANLGYRGYQQAFGVLSLLIVVMTYLYVAAVRSWRARCPSWPRGEKLPRWRGLRRGLRGH